MNIKQNDKQNIMNTYARQDVAIINGKGATCFDENNNKYIDFGSGIGTNSLGFCDEQWSNAVANQAKTLQHISNLYYTSPMVNVAKALCEKTGYDKVFFANSGAEANEGAIKLARKYSFDKYGKQKNRYKIITLINSFHGRTVTTLSATGQDVFHNFFFPFTDDFDYAVANDINDFKSKLDNTVCAVMLEFVQGEGGVNPLDKDYVKALFELCSKNDVLVIADEVQTGVGRTGKFLANEHYGVLPDITTLAKGLGGGLPIGAVLCNQKLSNTLSFGDHGTTFGGNPVACAGAQIVLKKIDDQLLKEVTAKSEHIKQRLSSVLQVEKIDGLGLMLGITLKTKKVQDLIKTCLNKGLIVLSAKEKLRLLPPLTITDDELNIGLDILINALQEQQEEIQ